MVNLIFLKYFVPVKNFINSNLSTFTDGKTSFVVLNYDKRLAHLTLQPVGWHKQMQSTEILGKKHDSHQHLSLS